MCVLLQNSFTDRQTQNTKHNLQMTDYYSPSNIFRNKAITIPKRNELRLKHKNRYNYNGNKQLLRKCSDDFNDFFTTKKLCSNYFEVPNNESGQVFQNLDVSENNTIMISNAQCMKLLRADSNLYDLQTIHLPGSTLTDSIFANSGAETRILTGHSDGTVNLIYTSLKDGGAKIVRRFNHKKFLSATEGTKNFPIRKLVAMENDDNFISLVNDSMFIYDIGNRSTPLYLKEFPGIESLAYNDSINYANKKLMALSGSNFGPAGISLLDLTSNDKIPNNFISNQYSPSINYFANPKVSYDCIWIDDYLIANTLSDTVKIWDIRSNSGQPLVTLEPSRGYIESLTYNKYSNRLFTNDDQNNIISWDLKNISKIKRGVLSQGFSSVINEIGNDNLEGTCQIGNMVVNGNNTLHNNLKIKVAASLKMNILNDDTLVSLNNNELGLHSIKEITCESVLNPGENTETNNQVNENNGQLISQQMSKQASQEEEVHSDTTLTSVREEVRIKPDVSSSENTLSQLYKNADNGISTATLIDYDDDNSAGKIDININKVFEKLSFAIEQYPEEQSTLSHKHSTSIYSLNQLALSGSTILN